MGIEYKLRFAAPDAEAVVSVLRRLPSAHESPTSPCRFDLGCRVSEQQWPQATVQVEPEGAYFCDYCGGSGRAMLGEVVARLASVFGTVTVEEL